MKASRRKVHSKTLKREERSSIGKTQLKEKAQTTNFMQQILNLNVKNFQIPERRGTSVNTLKRFSSFQETILPSETDVKAVKAEDSCMPSSEVYQDVISK